MRQQLTGKLIRTIGAIRNRSMLRKCREIEGWLTENEALGLYRIARGMPKGARILEIGSWKGKSTFVLASGLANGIIFALDPFDGAGEPGSRETYDQSRGEIPLVAQFQANLSRHGLWHKIELRRGYSKDFAGTFHDLDFVFIDGDHSVEGCAYDFRTFSGAVKQGRYLAFHDYDQRRSTLGPTWTVDHLVRKSSEWKFCRQWDSLILFQRVSV